MRGVYTASIKISGVTTAKTLLYAVCPATAAIEIYEATVTNVSSETNEQIDCSINHVTTIGSPTDSSTVLITKHEVADATSLLVDSTNLLGNLTAEPTTYAEAMGRRGSPSINGWFFNPAPEMRPVVGPSKAIGIRLITTITSCDLVVTFTFRELA